MTDDDLHDFISAYLKSENRPETAIEWLLFIDNAGFGLYKKRV